MANNTEVTLLNSAARTASTNSADQTNRVYRGVIVVVNVTVVPGSAPSIVFTVEGLDSLTGVYYTLLASAAVTGTGTTVLRVFPGATNSSNLVANDVLPKIWRVKAVAGNANSATYSVSACLIGAP